MTVMKMIPALNEAIREEMRRDERVFVLGEDARVGPFGLTADLAQEFGAERVRDMPICEGSIAGVAIGAAAAGLRPIVDFSLCGFSFLAFDQLVNNASMLRYMMAGQLTLPIVFHLQFGALGSVGAAHSHTNYSMFMNVPGLKIVQPNTPYDAKGLMKTAIRDNNPVMLFVPAAGRTMIGDVPEGEYTVPFGKARIVREGADVTVVALGVMLQRVEKVAVQFERYGIGIEIIDPRSLVPLDKKTIIDSVAKTGRLVVVDEGHATCGVSAEICTLVSEEAFESLKAPVRRVCSRDVPMPASPPMENYVIPDEKRISDAIETLLD